MTIKKTKLAMGVASAAMAVSGTLLAPQALAHSKAEKVAVATDRKVQALESQVNQMAEMMRAMQAELSRVKTQTAAASNNNRVEELESWMASVKNAPVVPESKDDMIFFRGGWSHSDNVRHGVSINSDAIGGRLGTGGQAPSDGWYFGAGIDWSINDNAFGLMDNTEVLGELMFDYKQFSTTTKGNLLADNQGSRVTLGTGKPRDVTVSMFSVSASPKIKFMKGSKFRPWIIPAGFVVNVISPPSESITVLNPGMLFGVGADYQVMDNIYVGVDGRYNLSFGDLDGVDTDGYEVGGYIGLGF